MELKLCEWCNQPIPFLPSHKGHPSHYKQLRFCSKKCASQWKAAPHRTLIRCETCGKEFYAPKSQPDRRYCSNECYLVQHASKPQTCQQCGKEFVAYVKQKYCSKKCHALSERGEGNPNYGKRRPGMFAHSAEVRFRLSEGRLGDKNPQWKGGRKYTGTYRMQTWVMEWALANLGDRCAICDAPNTDLHHIVPRRLFAHVVMAHFRQNLVMLCPKHHHKAEWAGRAARKAGRIRDIPFADRLPESILAQLERDGLVSRLTTECDFAPLGTAAQSVILPEWYSDSIA